MALPKLWINTLPNFLYGLTNYQPFIVWCTPCCFIISIEILTGFCKYWKICDVCHKRAICHYLVVMAIFDAVTAGTPFSVYEYFSGLLTNIISLRIVVRNLIDDTHNLFFCSQTPLLDLYSHLTSTCLQEYLNLHVFKLYIVLRMFNARHFILIFLRMSFQSILSVVMLHSLVTTPSISSILTFIWLRISFNPAWLSLSKRRIQLLIVYWS